MNEALERKLSRKAIVKTGDEFAKTVSRQPLHWTQRSAKDKQRGQNVSPYGGTGRQGTLGETMDHGAYFSCSFERD